MLRALHVEESRQVPRWTLALPLRPMRQNVQKDYGVIGHKQIDERAALLALTLIVEGNSIRSASRVTGLDKKTITKLVVDAGQRCEALLATKIQNVPVSDVQADERWGFVGKKEGHKSLTPNLPNTPPRRPPDEDPRSLLLRVSQSWEGPLPPLEILLGYEAACPGAADRLIKMAEDQGEHRRGLAPKVPNMVPTQWPCRSRNPRKKRILQRQISVHGAPLRTHGAYPLLASRAPASLGLGGLNI